MIRDPLRREALVALLLARLALAVVPYRWLSRSFTRASHQPELDGPARDQIRQGVRRAVQLTAGAIPGTTCFPRAIAAQALLRRRGVSTTLYWGAARDPGGGLIAHVWLQDGDRDVIGMHAAVDYRPVISYAPGRVEHHRPTRTAR